MSEKQVKKVLSTKIDDDLLEKISMKAEALNMSESEYLRKLLEEDIKKTGLREDEWAIFEGKKRQKECFYNDNGECLKHRYEKGQMPEALKQEAERTQSLVTIRREFPWFSSPIDYDILRPSPIFCRECRLWRPKSE
jgi:predicted transcriptional regulator